jgi:hypothetical protein
MRGPSVEKLREELKRLMREHLESLQRETFLGISPNELRQQRKQLQRIREVSADFLEALKRQCPK